MELAEVKMFDISNTEVAQQGTATQSSDYAWPGQFVVAPAAIDGKTNTISHTLNKQGKNQRIVS